MSQQGQQKPVAKGSDEAIDDLRSQMAKVKVMCLITLIVAILTFAVLMATSDTIQKILARVSP